MHLSFLAFEAVRGRRVRYSGCGRGFWRALLTTTTAKQIALCSTAECELARQNVFLRGEAATASVLWRPADYGCRCVPRGDD